MWAAVRVSTIIFHKYTKVAKGQDGVEVMIIIDLVMVKKYMLCYVHDGRGMRQSLLDPHDVLCTWIKRRKVLNEARRIRSGKLREHQYIEGYERCLESRMG